MNAKVGVYTRSKVRQILGAAAIAAALLVGNVASAQPHGGGGFHGGFQSSGGFHGGGAHFAPHAGIGVRPGGAYGYGYRGYRGYGGYGWHGAYGYGWHGGYYGFHPWAGGYWGGGWWPAAYYGWGYPLFLATLPALYATYWWDGMPYYYVNNVYYTWNAGQNGYVVTDPPMVASGDQQSEETAAPDGTVSTPAPAGASTGAHQASGIIAYPRNGQSDQQLATDKYECHVWAKGQTGFDPTSQSSSGASPNVRSAYDRAIAACLDGRGYTVR